MELESELQREKRKLLWTRIKNVLLIFLALVVIGLPSFFYFHMSTKAHLVFREAKNIKLATSMLAVEYYGVGESIYDGNSADGMESSVRERLLSVTQTRGDLRLLAYDKKEREVTAFTYESGHIKVTYSKSRQGEERWVVDYMIRYAEYGAT